MAKPQVTASLAWTGDLTFSAVSGEHTMTLDGRSKAGPSPMQTFAFSIAGCMAIDVVDILTKGRHPVRALDVRFAGDRADTSPHRFTAVTLTFIVQGNVPPDAVRRAIALSHEKYCSVSNTLRSDVAFTTNFEVQP